MDELKNKLKGKKISLTIVSLCGFTPGSPLFDAFYQF